MRILVTGSRRWVDESVVYTELRKATENVENETITLVHGGARGADLIAARWALMFGWIVEEHPANWESCGSECDRTHWRYREGRAYCPRSGFIRNDKMVKLGADICLAFYKGDSKGTDMCAKIADKAGIPVLKIMDPYD